MLKANLLLRQRHWNNCSWPPSLSNFFRWKIDFSPNIRSINGNILSGNDSRISETLSFGISSFHDAKNLSILNTTLDYILSTKRFDVPLTNFWFVLKHLCIGNMSFKFDYLNVKLFAKFSSYYIIGLGILRLLCLVNKVFLQIIITFTLVYRLLLSFLFINKCIPVKELSQITPWQHTSSCSINYFVMAFRLGSQVRPDI